MPAARESRWWVKMFKIVRNLARVFQALIMSSLRIDRIKYIDLFMTGWIYAFFNTVIGTVYLMKGQFSPGITMLLCGITAGACLVYIGRTAGKVIPPSAELVDIKLSMDPQSTMLLAGLIRQAIKFNGPNAIILTEDGGRVVNGIADNIEAATVNHLNNKRGK